MRAQNTYLCHSDWVSLYGELILRFLPAYLLAVETFGTEEYLQGLQGARPLHLMVLLRAAERLPLQTAIPLELLVDWPAERLALETTLQLYPAEDSQCPGH